MQLQIAGLRTISTTEHGAFVEYEVAAAASDTASVVSALLAALPEGADIAAPEAGPAECYHECRRANGALHIKRGCHGSFGTWRAATPAEALEWLLPSFHFAVSNPRYEQVRLRVPRAQACLKR